MENLGIFLGGNFPSITLSQFENVLANLTALMYWAAGNIATDTFIREQNVADRTYYAALLPGEAMGALTESRLNSVWPQVIIGLVTSVSLLVLATVTSHGIGDRNTPVDSLGVLELMWLIRDQPALQDAVGQVNNPTPENLRAAGMFEMSVVGIASAHGASYSSVKLDGEE
ncbi:hypothetical protein AcW1_008776 [Taiwanofungus camphoratus]|nr:hypothetical protein AcW1_008776 [Antrodia cinnamomea]